MVFDAKNPSLVRFLDIFDLTAAVVLLLTCISHLEAFCQLNNAKEFNGFGEFPRVVQLVSILFYPGCLKRRCEAINTAISRWVSKETPRIERCFLGMDLLTFGLNWGEEEWLF